MNKYASGPWLYKAPADVMRKGLRICSVNAGMRDLTMGQQVDVAAANARLIAAAPELLEVAEHCRDLLMRYEINHVNGEEIADEAISKLNAAIAKARGAS